MSGRIPFAAEPEIGARMQIDQQNYVLIKKSIFKRRDSSPGLMLDWETHCPVCGAMFRTSSTLEGNMPTRRCREHRAAGRQVTRGPRKKLSIRVEPESQS